MTDVCIFCGKTISDSDKTYEHVIPQWLIKQTGDINRNIMFLPFVTDSSPQHIPFKDLCFPAHKSCNNDHAKLEDRTKNIINKVLNSKPVNSNEVNLLLKWFDKVRIGLWLGYNSNLNANEQIFPHFYINQRVNKADRILVIEKMQKFGERVNFCGAESPVFKYMPSAFCLCINDYIFTNASRIGLCSYNLGFPSFDCFEQNKNGELIAQEPVPPRKKIKEPVINYLQNNKDSIIIYQPIFKDTQDFCQTYDSTHIQEHSLDYKNGIGGIFIQQGFSAPTYLQNSQIITPCNISTSLSDAVIQVRKLQNDLVLDWKKHCLTTQEPKEKYHKWIALNNDYINFLQSMNIPF